MVRKTPDDGPSIGELVDRGEVDPERIMSGTAFDALQMVLSRPQAGASSQGRSSPKDLAERSGIASATLSRLGGREESGTRPLRRYGGSPPRLGLS